MNINKVNEIALTCSRYLWNREDIPKITINNRLSSTFAWFVVEDNKIEINKKLLNQSTYIIIDIILHELCHWYCYITNKKYSDENEDFKNELNRIQSFPTGTITANYKYLYIKSKYKCNCCGKEKTVLETLSCMSIYPKDDINCCDTIMQRVDCKRIYIDYIPTNNVKILSTLV